MNDPNPPESERKRLRHVLHRWKDRRRRKKASESQSILEPRSNNPPTNSNLSNDTNTALVCTTKLPLTSNPRRNTAPADFFTRSITSAPSPAPIGIPSPTLTEPPPSYHRNTNATTQYVTAAQIAARVTADEESLQRMAALLRRRQENPRPYGEQVLLSDAARALLADAAQAERERGLARLRAEMAYKSDLRCQSCGRRMQMGVRCGCGELEIYGEDDVGYRYGGVARS